MTAWVRATPRELARQLPDRSRAEATVVADQLAQIVEGLYGSTAALGTEGPACHARSLAALVIDAGRPRPGDPGNASPFRTWSVRNAF